MELVVALILVLIVLWLVMGPTVGSASPKCPPGYVPSPTKSTWAGWKFECVPEGLGAALVSADTLTRPMTTIYAPIVSATGADPTCGGPAAPTQYAGRATVYAA